MWFQRLYSDPERGLGFQGCSCTRGGGRSSRAPRGRCPRPEGAAAAITMAPADLWKARLAVKTLRRDQREAIAEVGE